MKQWTFSCGRGLDFAHAARRTPHAARRTQIYGLLNFGFVVMLLLTFARPAAKAQPGCISTYPISLEYDSGLGNPISFGICDLSFDATLELIHYYPDDHDYTVSITYDPTLFDLLGTSPALTNVSTQTDAYGNTVLTGTFTAPFVTEELSIVNLIMHFRRLDRWDSGVLGDKKKITYTVSDPSCSPALLATFDPWLFCDAYIDLRNAPYNHVSDLVSNGWLSDCPGTESVLIGDELIIDQDHCFTKSTTPNLTIAMLAGSKITVESGYSLLLTHVNLLACDQELAQGIVVESGAALLADNSSINDCRFAIDAKPGSAISLISNDFFDNYIGLNLDMSGVPEADKRANILAMTDNSFSTAQAAIKAPYSGMPEPVEDRGYCGIRLNQYRDFNVFGTNAFSTLANGILGFNSTGNIGNMTFDDMNSSGTTSVYQHEGFGIYLAGKGADWFNIGLSWLPAMTFNNCKTGIRATTYAGKVEKTTMTNVNVGIDWSNSHTRDVRLRNNTITAQHFGIHSGLNEPLHPISTIADNTVTITGQGAGANPVSGIKMDELGLGYTPPNQTIPVGLKGWDVNTNTVTTQKGGYGIQYRNGFLGLLENNTVNDEGLTSSPGPYDGIRVEGTAFSQVNFNDVTRSTNAGGNAASRAIHSQAGFANGFTCNCVDNTGVGIQYFDLADFTNNVRGNKLNNHDGTGLQLGADNIGNTYIGVQYHTGNEWDLVSIPTNGFGGINWGTTNDVIKLSQFFVDPNEKNGALNPPVDPESWFQADPTEDQSFDCSNGCIVPTNRPPFTGETDVPTKLDWTIAVDSLPTDGWDGEMRWKGAYRLYRKMLRQPSIESYATVYEDFKEAHDSLSTGRLAYIAEERSKIFAITAMEDSTLEYYRQYWHGEMDNLLALDSLRQAGDTSVLVSQYDTAVLESTAARIQYAAYLDTLVQARKTKIQTLRMQNAGITATLTPAANHKTVNNIVFNLLLYDTLQTGDLATLESIAESCPFEGGDAVYEARAIMAYYTGQEYDDYAICAVAERSQKVYRKNAGVVSEEIIVYPNPSTGEVFFSATDDLQVRVFSSVGQLQLEKTVNDGRLNLAHLPPGLYRFQIFRDGQGPITHSVILLNR